MSRVETIEKTRFGLYVTLDDGEQLRLHRRSLADLPLQVGDEIEPVEYLERLAAKQYPRAMEAALYSLEGGDRTESRMREYLRRQRYPESCVDAVLARLKEQGLIDDRQFACRYAENHPNQGKYALQRKLRARGIDGENARMAADMLSDEDQLSACQAEAAKLARRYASDAPRDRQRKLSQALARRGFGWSVIRQTLGEEEEYGDE